jgi:hypothetical protein
LYSEEGKKRRAIMLSNEIRLASRASKIKPFVVSSLLLGLIVPNMSIAIGQISGRAPSVFLSTILPQ